MSSSTLVRKAEIARFRYRCRSWTTPRAEKTTDSKVARGITKWIRWERVWENAKESIHVNLVILICFRSDTHGDDGRR
jgi:hypothetical protein